MEKEQKYQFDKEAVLKALDFRTCYESELNLTLGKPDKKGNCPNIPCCFHADKGPSLSINVNDGKWNCFGCDSHGSVFDFHMKKHNCDFPAALKTLAEFAGVQETRLQSPQGLEKKWEAARLYLGKDGKEYLVGRGFSEETIKNLWDDGKIGYSSKAYVGKDTAGNNILKPAIVFPVNTLENELVGLQNTFFEEHEVTDRDGNPETVKKRNEKGSKPSEGFFIIETHEGGSMNIITEACIDALSIWAGYDKMATAVAIFSTSHTDKLGQKDFQSWVNRDGDPENEPVIFFDKDENQAGEKAARKAIKHFDNVSVATWGYEQYKDANDFLKHGRQDLIPDICKKAIPKEKFATEADAKEILESYIEEINSRHFLTMLGGRVVICTEKFDMVLKSKDIEISSVTDIKHLYENYQVPTPTKKEPKKTSSAADLWMKHPKRRYREHGILFEPGAKPGDNESEGYFNLYQGFTAEPKKGNWDLFESHIYFGICSGNERYFNWVKAWMARLVQDPGGERPGTALVLKGQQGTGKDTFTDFFGSIFGKHYISTAVQSQITGKHNNHLKDALLVFCNEGFFAGDHSAAGVLKHMITSQFNVIEPKGKDCFKVANHISLIIASNNDWVVPAGLEERRFCVLEVADSLKINGKKKPIRNNKQWFGPIYEEMRNGGVAAMLHDLLDMDISEFNLRKIPRTDALLEQIMENAHAVHKWWFDKLKDGEDSDIWGSWVDTDTLYNEFILFADVGKHKLHGFTKTALIKQLRQVCPDIERTRSNGKYGYKFNSLENCRIFFSNRVEIDIDW
ncbi:MAG: hypothetical protein GY744_06975 [Gammaproteobacteria bacterium]|nr:hypothetical protein [Gammaproteobacteria bacterium]